MTPAAEVAFAPDAAPARPRKREGYLFSPTMDFLCLGGGSLILIAVVTIGVPEAVRLPTMVAIAVLVHFINSPHFAHSYQIFYRGYAAKAFAWSTPPVLRARYVFAGLVVPVLLVAFFAAGVAWKDATFLGYGLNIMGIFVGWHYVKQGYGMIVVDSVLKKNFFNETEKRMLLANSYAVWVAVWLHVNHTLKSRDLWGLETYTIPFPTAVVIAATVLAALTSIGAVIAIMARRHVRTGRPFPLSGATAYFAALYVWLLASWLDPIVVMVVPVFHSLQYQIVVWRFELNRQRGLQPDGTDPQRPARRWDTPRGRFALFSVLGILSGYIGFWSLPQFLDRFVDYDKGVFGATLFMFLFWVFINVHHYFLDSVMWRRENPDIGRYLFAAR